MNTKEKEKSKRGKAIIGIAIAVIMFATLMTMIPAVSAHVVSKPYLSYRQPGNRFLVNPGFVAIDIANASSCHGKYENYTSWPTDSVKIGQELIFRNTKSGDTVLIEGVPDTNTDGETFSASAFVNETVEGTNKTISGIYFDTTSMEKAGTYILKCDEEGLKQTLSVSKPVIPIELKVASDVVSTITTGTRLRLDCSGISDLKPNDCVDLEIIDPDGHQIKTWNVSGVTQYFDEINVSTLIDYGLTDETKEIDTTNWILGTYSFHIVTEEENARGLDLDSETKTLKVLKGEVDVDIDRTDVGELEPVTVTVTGVYTHIIHVRATAGQENVEFEEGKGDFSDIFNQNTSTYGVYEFDVEMDEDGRMEFAVKFHDTGAYTIEVTDPETNDWDTEDVKVAEKDVTFNIPPTLAIGEDLEIQGTTNAGDYIDIAIDDYIVYTGIPVEDDMTFEETLQTPETPGTGAPGTITIKAFIRSAGEAEPEMGKDVTDIDDDGRTSVLLTTGSLTVEISPKEVAQEDEFTVEGTAEGSDFVDIVTVAPKGGSGRGINPGSVSGVVRGITHDSSAVSDTDYSYLKEIYVDEDADTGKYLVIVVSPGRNGVYDEINDYNLFGPKAFGEYGEYGSIEDLQSKSQEQILSIIMDETVESPGSDDLISVNYVDVETPTVALNPITDVGVGEPLLVTGSSNREEGSTITVTVRGPGGEELVPASVPIENGTFNATFDTTDAVVGTYTVMADDGDGHTDDATVNIGAAVPTPTPVVATPTPTVPSAATPTPTVPSAAPTTPTPTPVPATPTPKPPGFEAVFAIAGLLAVAYLVLRRRK